MAVTGRFAVTTGGLPLEAVVEAGRAAESLGYEALLVGEVRLEADAFVTAGAVLAATQRLRCGPGIANAYDRHPVALARAAAALDRVAPGRALLGIGRSERADVERVGLAWSPSPLEDALRIIRPLLAGQPVTHRGRRWSASFDAAPERASAGGRVPVLLAAVGPRTLRLGGALADGVILNYGAPSEYVRWAVEQVASGARDAGRDPDEVDVYGLVLVACSEAPDFAARLESVRRTVSAVMAIPDQGATLSAPLGGPPREWDDATLRRYAAVGHRAECLARIEEYRAAGLRCAVLMPSGMRALHGPVAMIPR